MTSMTRICARRKHVDTTIRQSVLREVSAWTGVQVGDSDESHPQVHYGKIELGHLHGDAVAHLPFPRRVRDSLIERGEVTPHPLFPSSGWVEKRITGPDDVARVIELFRMNYDRASARAASTQEAQGRG
jgi:hypothetical protein